MADDDDIDERFRRLTAEFDAPPAGSVPPAAPPTRATRASLREVKREAKQRRKAAKKAAKAGPVPIEPHRAWLAGPVQERAPRRARSERTRTILIGATVVAIMSGLVYVQFFRGAASSPAAGTPAVGDLGRPIPGVDEADAPLGTPPVVEDQPGRYAFLSTQPGSTAPVAYDPCRPIRYVVRTEHAPREAARLISSALATLSAATGLAFESAGATDEIPSEDRAPYQPATYGNRWAPVLIGWDTAAENPRLDGTTIGFGGSSSAGVTGGPLVYVSGNVALSAEWYASVLRTPKGYAEAEAVLLHELGHVLGLGHVPDKSQIMFERERPQVTKLGAGDLAGLAKLGGGACEPRL